MFKSLFQSLGAYFTAVQVVNKHRLWKYFLVPGLISLGYGLLIFWLGTWADDKIAGWATGWIPFEWLRNLVAGAISGVFWIILFFFTSLTYRFVVLILLSPFLTTMTERVERAETGKDPLEANWSRAIYDIYRAIIMGVRNLLLEILLTFPMLFFPILNPVGIYLTQSFYAGFGLVDYSLERRQFSIGQSIAFMRRNRATCTGLGIGFQILILIPIVGWFMAPTLGAVAGTLRVLEIERETLGPDTQESSSGEKQDEDDVEEITINFD